MEAFPYHDAYLAVLVLLVSTAVAWRCLPCTHRPWLRRYACLASTASFAASCIETSAAHHPLGDKLAVFVLQGCLFVTGALLVEVAVACKPRIYLPIARRVRARRLQRPPA